MAEKDILLLGNPQLYDKSDPVEKGELTQLAPKINLMFDTVLDFRNKYGVGRAIAAPQIGLHKRIICLNMDKPIAMINPVVSDFSDEMFEVWDDCMSFPNLLVKVLRHKKLTLTFYDLKHTLKIVAFDKDLKDVIFGSDLIDRLGGCEE